jgi:tetratricopeptide (TPR) repeat protein
VILKTGYAPEEQYRSSGRQGPWTDVYAITATLYKVITGQSPPDALDRLERDTLVPPSQLEVDIPPAAEQALLKGLAVKATDRFQTIQDFQAALLGMMPAIVAPVTTAPQTQAVPVEDFQMAQSMQPAAVSRPQSPLSPPLQAPRQKRSPLTILASAIALIGIILVVVLVWQGIKTPSPPKPGPKDREARRYLEQGIKSYNAGNAEGYTNALRMLEKAVELKRDLPEAQYYLGLTLNQFSRNQDAVAAFSKAIAAKKEFAEAHYALSLTYIALGKPEAAQEQYDILRNLNEDLAKQLSPKLAHLKPPPPPPKPPEPERKAKLDLAVLKNCRYLINGERVTLNDGKFERGDSTDNPNFLRVYFEKAAIGKLNNNETEDAAVIYWYNGGGSGCFYQLGVITINQGKPFNISSISLGDRVRINEISIKNGAIVLDMFIHGLKDGLANPTVRTIKKYKLSDDKLVSIPSTQKTAKVNRNNSIRQSSTDGTTTPKEKKKEEPFTFKKHTDIRLR